MGRSEPSALFMVTWEGFCLEEQLIQAYRSTDYRIAGKVQFSLRIDEPCVECDAEMDAHDSTTAAFLTAWNPYSQVADRDQNIAAQEQLVQDLETVSLSILSGEGVDPTGAWPTEPSLLAIGITRDQAVRLAGKYQQNAFVWLKRGHPAEIILL